MIESTPFADWMEDASKSSVAGKVGYAPARTAAVGRLWPRLRDLGGRREDDTRMAAGRFIAWATSRE